MQRESIGKPGTLPFSPAVRFGNLLFVSGQVGRDPQTGRLAPGGMEAETRQTLENLRRVLMQAGATLGDVLKTTVYITDFGQFETMNRVYREFFPSEPPARATVQVAGLAGGAVVEIEAVAGLAE